MKTHAPRRGEARHHRTDDSARQRPKLVYRSRPLVGELRRVGICGGEFANSRRVADCIKQERSAATAVAEDAKAKAKLILTIDPSLYVHIKKAGSTKDLWQKLKSMFDDSGFSRKITLLRNLISIRLDGCDSMTTYITQIIETAQKLAGTGFPVNDEWIGCLLLAGLPDKYFLMIMAIEHSGIAITADVIKTKLIDLSDDSSEAGNAFFSRGQHYRQHRNVGNKEKNDSSRSNNGAAGGGTSSSNKKKTDKQRIKCYKCKEFGHYKSQCTKEQNQQYVIKATNAFSAVFLSGNYCKNDFYLDSGASVHMTPNVNIVKNPCFTPQIKEIIAANKSAMPVLCCGDVNIITKTDGCRYDVTLKEVSCVPNLSTNLISIIGIADEMNGVYKLRLESKQCLLTSTTEDTSSEVWHRRMGHLKMNHLKKMRDGAVTGISYSDKSEISKSTCTVCCEGKQSRLPFGHAGTRSSKPLDVIHADVCGPMEVTSIGRSRTDNGLEFCSNEFEDHLKAAGIIHQKTNAYTPEQNGMSERINRTIIERARCLLFDSGLDKKFWAEATNTAIYLRNRSVASLNNKTPYELWMKQKPDLSHIRIFGSRIMVHVPKEKRLKWDSKSRKHILVGFAENVKGYRVYDPVKCNITTSRDVIVHENTERKNTVDDSITVSVGDTIQNNKSGSYVESSEKEIAKKTSQNDECSNISSESEYLNALTDLDSTLQQTTASEEDDEPELIRKPWSVMVLQTSALHPVLKLSRIL
ncbi:Retrovirus-related Pol polyprotein from transposon TNT 1-94 [Eumeta japonica]|uniref:Retrovirus-related Pol polyprotein from transposon TNT 1-94 n=1 Tax=Eumeta variegata TaxID=151549 RepID=A0A4C1X187_EUMVA|nr:Retrovirus-related Pol polyprotein from transposon TNT 1-94 [Eumeta japonica]